MRDWAGLDSSEETSEVESAGPGDGASLAGAREDGPGIGVEGLSTGRVASRCLLDCGRSEGGMVPALCLSPLDVLPEDDIFGACGRLPGTTLKVVPGPAVLGVSGALPSCLLTGVSLRIDRDEGALPWPGSPGAEAVLPMAMADSEPGTGDGAAELLTAAVAFRIWACI